MSVVYAFAPLLVLGAGCVILMLSIAWRRAHRRSMAIASATLLLALAALARVPGRPVGLDALLQADGYFVFGASLVLLSALAVVIFSAGYIDRLSDVPRDEYFLLLLIATFGALVLLCSVHFAAFFLGLEVLSVALLGLIAYPRHRGDATEAGMKYLVLAGGGSAFLVFGMALIYAASGSLAFSASAATPDMLAWRNAGIALLLVGLGTKLSIVPFHMWAPDVYDGAPAPVTAYVAVVSKVAVFIVMVRYFALGGAYGDGAAVHAVMLFAVLSMLAGNLLALRQNNIKRLLAYSSIAHLGYLLVAFLSPRENGIAASSYYLAVYAVTTLGAFGVVSLLSRGEERRDAASLDNYRGLFWTRPALAASLTLMLLSLAGIPPTMGFIGKAYVMAAGVGTGLTLPLAALVLGSIIGLYYYLRVVVVMASPVQAPYGSRPAPRPDLPGQAALVVLTASLVVFGLYPSTLIGAALRHGPGVRPGSVGEQTRASRATSDVARVADAQPWHEGWFK